MSIALKEFSGWPQKFMMIAGFITLTLLVIPAQTLGDSRDTEPHYQTGSASRDGIGKFYMGREISQVMGHLGAGWLERPTREREERTDLLLQKLSLNTTDHVADLGAGTGYFSFPIARQVPAGKVLAVDIEPEMLRLIEQRKSDEKVGNIDTLLASETHPNIPKGSVDLVLLVDAHHEFSHPREVMDGVVKGLKPGGRVVLVEYRGADRDVPIKRLHRLT
jgi:SAM-dependent methyltransferase